MNQLVSLIFDPRISRLECALKAYKGDINKELTESSTFNNMVDGYNLLVELKEYFNNSKQYYNIFFLRRLIIKSCLSNRNLELLRYICEYDLYVDMEISMVDTVNNGDEVFDIIKKSKFFVKQLHSKYFLLSHLLHSCLKCNIPILKYINEFFEINKELEEKISNVSYYQLMLYESFSNRNKAMLEFFLRYATTSQIDGFLGLLPASIRLDNFKRKNVKTLFEDLCTHM